MKTRTVLALPADTHAGSTVGLMPPGQWQFANGGYWNHNRTQQILDRLWLESWKQVRDLRKGARLIVGHVGDATEGLHHDAVDHLSPRIDEHERIHIAAMDQALTTAEFDPRKGDEIFYVAGTPAHVQSGAQSEERIARNWDGIVPRLKPTQEDKKDGSYVWPRLLLEINGKLFDIAHHGANLGTRPWTRHNPFRSILAAIYWQCLESGERMPDYWIRAHKHVAHFDIYPGHKKTINGFICPSMQGKTEFSYKIAAGMPASLGLIWFDIHTDGTVIPGRNVIEYNPDEVLRL